MLLESCSSANQVFECGLSKVMCNGLQILIDIGSDMGVFARMRDVVREHVQANPLDFTAESSVHANTGSDPMKLALNIWWSYCYNCEHCHTPLAEGQQAAACMSTPLSRLTIHGSRAAQTCAANSYASCLASHQPADIHTSF